MYVHLFLNDCSARFIAEYSNLRRLTYFIQNFKKGLSGFYHSDVYIIHEPRYMFLGKCFIVYCIITPPL